MSSSVKLTLRNGGRILAGGEECIRWYGLAEGSLEADGKTIACVLDIDQVKITDSFLAEFSENFAAEIPFGHKEVWVFEDAKITLRDVHLHLVGKGEPKKKLWIQEEWE